ncbi:PTS system mannose/fructose/sorbose family transporter subunit IID [Desulfothermus okinawensis]
MGRTHLLALLKCFFRTYFIGSMYNTKGLQNLGLLYVMDPGLKLFYGKDTKEYLKARGRYLSHYNSHPYFLPLLAGYFLFIECRISQKMISPKSLETIKETSAYTLSAIGDSFFGGSLLVTWALTEVLLVLYGQKTFALLFLLASFFTLQAFRFALFWKGWTRGLAFFQLLKEINLIEWSNRLKILNGFILVWIWYRISCLSSYDHFNFFLLGGIVVSISSFLIYRNQIPREILVVLFFVVMMFFL